MKALIEKILITERVRKEITRIDELAADIKVNGLLHPITVMPVDGGEYRLLAGLRRLKAMERLGKIEIEVKVVSPANAEAELRIEISENEQREPFTFSEQMDFGRMLEEIEREKAKERMSLGGKGGIEEGVDGRPHLPTGKSRDVVASKIDMSGRQYDRAKYIAKNASDEVIKELDKGERTINKTYDELKAKEKAHKTVKSIDSEAIEADVDSDDDNQEDNGSDDCSESTAAATPTANAPTVDPPKTKVHPASVLSKADQEAEARNIAFNALSPQKKVVELQRQLKEERARAAHAESELERLKELRHNDVFHKDGIINNLKARLANAEARIKELEDKYCAD